MDAELRRLERIVESGEATADEIQEWKRLKLAGGCEAGAHAELISDGSPFLACMVCGVKTDILDPFTGIPANEERKTC